MPVTWALTEAPRQLSRRLCGATRAARLHLGEHAAEYGFLFELLSLGLPLLCVLHELVAQMLEEVGPLCTHQLVLWAEQQLGVRLL